MMHVHMDWGWRKQTYKRWEDDSMRNWEDNSMKNLVDCSYKLTAGKPIAITDVEIYNNRVTLVRFSDGSFTKSVCSDNDIFDLDIGITICLLKRVLTYDRSKPNDGTKRYNTMLKAAYKVMEEKEKKKRAETEEKAKRRERQKKIEQKRKESRQRIFDDWADIVSEGILKAAKEKEE